MNAPSPSIIKTRLKKLLEKAAPNDLFVIETSSVNPKSVQSALKMLAIKLAKDGDQSRIIVVMPA